MKSGLRLLVPLLCLAGLLTAGPSAHADTFYFNLSVADFGGGGGIMTGGGSLTAVADPTIAGAFDITSLSGYLGGDTLTLLPCATYDPNNPCVSSGNEVFYDNLLYPGGTGISGITVLDYRGIGLDLGDGVKGSFFASSSHQVSLITNLPHDNSRLGSFSIVPEPGSFILVGTGLLGMADIVRRRLKS